MFQAPAGANRGRGLQYVQAGQGRRSAELVAGEAVAVEERLEVLVFAEERVEYGLRGEGGGHRQVAAGQAFGQGHEIGLHAFVVAGEERGAGVRGLHR